QAEDGIRDFHVTGVQTCALPISVPKSTTAAVNSTRTSKTVLFSFGNLPAGSSQGPASQNVTILLDTSPSSCSPSRLPLYCIQHLLFNAKPLFAAAGKNPSFAGNRALLLQIMANSCNLIININ